MSFEPNEFGPNLDVQVCLAKSSTLPSPEPVAMNLPIPLKTNALDELIDWAENCQKVRMILRSRSPGILRTARTH
jgi:hypothetical protein